MARPDDRAPRPVDGEVTRRTVLRGVAVIGLAGAAGVPLAGCGGGADDVVAGDVAQPVAAGPTPAPSLPSKSEIFRRTPEPRGERPREPRKPPSEAERTAGDRPDAGAPPAGEPEPAAGTGNQAGSGDAGSKGAGSKGDEAATAKRGDDEKEPRGRKTAEPEQPPGPATPEPLPPGTLARTSDIPAGGGVVYPNEKIVVTQPAKGTFKGFSATCTHTGCTVEKVEAGAIVCPCHGSRFGIADGAVQQGPADAPLPPEPITVDAKTGTIRRG